MLVLLKEIKARNESYSFCVWCKSRELGGRGSPRFPSVTPVLESFSSDLLQAIISYWEELHLESCLTSTMELSCKNTLTIFAKKLNRRCSIGLWMWSFKIKFHKIIRFRIISKITVNRKKNSLIITNLRHRYIPCKFLRFW